MSAKEQGEMPGSFPPRLIIEWDTDNRKFEARRPLGHKGKGNYLSCAEHTAALKQAEQRGRIAAMEEALNAIDSYEKSFAIWPGKISLNEIKGWLLNRKASGESKESGSNV